MTSALTTDLARLVPDGVTDAADELAHYGRDWTRVFTPNPSCVVFPKTHEQVAGVLSYAHERSLPVVPSGGRTGLSGGAVAKDGEIVLSLARMAHMGAVDAHGLTVHVQAGAVTEAVHHHAGDHGLTWPVDFASKGSSQVGGNIATNAGGVRVIRYGLTRQWVLGLDVVTANGDTLRLNGALEKNNTGPDLRQLFIGSEGILGIITGATLKLTRLPGKTHVMLFAVADLPAVFRLFAEARVQGPFTIMAYEFFTDLCLARLMRHRNVRSPFTAPASHYVLLEVEQAQGDALEAWVAKVFEEQLVQDGVLAQHGGEAQELWALREGISESLSATGLPHKNDVALPIANLEAFCARFAQVFQQKYAGWEICIFGHVGDGNLHINVMKPDALSKEDFLGRTSSADTALFELLAEHGGSISAEHGIGLLKKNYLHYTRSPQELAIMRGLKSTLDPRGILNPGKVL